jgi:methionine sulfoxide reductase heme-binding subunit
LHEPSGAIHLPPTAQRLRKIMASASTGGTRRGIDPDYVLWAVMALPGAYIVAHGFLGLKFPYVGWSGILACWFIILAMLVTPAMMLFRPLIWLKPKRRYFGVAGFAYTMLHLAFWAVNLKNGGLLLSFTRPKILVGWIAFIILVPLALTSYDRAVRVLGPRWKTLQRWVYPAAFFTLIHWLMTTDNFRLAILSSLPVIVLSVWRLVRWQTRGQAA